VERHLHRSVKPSARQTAALPLSLRTNLSIPFTILGNSWRMLFWFEMCSPIFTAIAALEHERRQQLHRIVACGRSDSGSYHSGMLRVELEFIMMLDLT
jgi:hypothetical protein